MAEPPSTISPARQVAYRVIRRVFEQGAYADRALHTHAAGLQPRDRALATTLVFGTVQRRATLDHAIAQLSRRSPRRLDAAVLSALRLGMFQLLFLDRVAAHAAVSDSVELVKQEQRHGAGLVNAVLRRAAREGVAILDQLRDDTPPAAAVRHSVPEWLSALWWQELGPEGARSLLRAVNRPAEPVLRVNTLAASPGDVVQRLPVATRPVPGIPEGLILQEAFDAHGSELFARGEIMPQSRGSMLVARMLGPRPGERVLDLCAAPGGKTTHLAALMGGRGEIMAVERHPGRAQALRRTLARMGAGNVVVAEQDATRLALPPEFDRVLVDPPCSGLGTLQSRPDRRWRASAAAVGELARLQARVLRAGAAATASGGVLVYSVCTISSAEGRELVRAFLSQHPDFAPEQTVVPWARPQTDADGLGVQLRPDLDGTDGFFIARLRRR